MAVAVSINMVSLGIQLLVYPFVTSPIHYTGSLAIFVGFNYVSRPSFKLIG